MTQNRNIASILLNAIIVVVVLVIPVVREVV